LTNEGAGGIWNDGDRREVWRPDYPKGKTEKGKRACNPKQSKGELGCNPVKECGKRSELEREKY
jgi:hypothetical protein